MIPGPDIQLPIRNRIPRESGDDPCARRSIGQWATVFPARAGMIRGRTSEVARRPVFPARAGMIRIHIGVTSLQRGIPRESGDDPSPGLLLSTRTVYSPRERG